MNILYLANHLNVGGITSYVFSLAKGLKNRGHKVYVASSGGELADSFIKEGIGHFTIPIKTKAEISCKVLLSRAKLILYIKENNIDIIHANTRVTQVLACLIRRPLHKPYVSTCHGFFKKRLSRLLFPCWGDRVIAISQQVKEHLADDFRVSQEKIRVIHNGIDADKFRVPACPAGRQGPEPRLRIKKQLGLGDGPVVGIVARLSEVKGHIYLIRAMRAVVDKYPAAQLLIAGEGKMEDELVRLSRSLGLEKQIVFIPSVRDTAEVLGAMDLFVLPSLKEGLGLSLMEAMAAGLAVIGSDTGGIRSLIQDNHNGILVEPADPQGISTAILRLLEDPGQAQRLGDNAASFIKENFSLEKMVLETESLYLECLNAR